MYHLRLCKGLSYCSAFIKATKNNPDVFTDSKELVDKAIQSGFFMLVENESPKEPEEEVLPKEEPEVPAQDPIDYEELAKKTKGELLAFAREHKIDTSKARSKAEILMDISHAFGGSYTMMELQQEV